MAFVICDLVDHFGSSNLWFGSADDPGTDTACFIVPAEEKHVREASADQEEAVSVARWNQVTSPKLVQVKTGNMF